MVCAGSQNCTLSVMLPVLPLTLVPVHTGGGGYLLGLVSAAASAPEEVAAPPVLLVVRPLPFVDVAGGVSIGALAAPGEGGMA